jgi:hypothetical protein
MGYQKGLESEKKMGSENGRYQEQGAVVAQESSLALEMMAPGERSLK